MNPEHNDNTESPTIEEGVKSMIHDVKAKAHDTYENFEEKAKQSPGKTVLIAVAAGYCLHHLPLRALLIYKIRLAAVLAKPALYAFGAAKLCEFVQKQARR